MTLQIQFKAKVISGYFKFPSKFSKSHVLSGLATHGRIASYSNSNLFEGVLARALKHGHGLPLGQLVHIDQLEKLPVTFKAGFLHTFTIEVQDQ